MKLQPIPCPCESCLRWPECNGVAADDCPLWRDYDEKTESGLLED